MSRTKEWCAALVFMLVAATVQAQTPEDIVAPNGLPTCLAWLATPATEHDGESWLLGFWSGINQPTPKLNIGPRGHVDLMVEEMRTFCKRSPSSTLVAAALRVVEMSQMGMFTDPPSSK